MNKERIIVIGGLSAGPSAAAKARRVNENAEIILFEKTANISYATCGIPYALSGKIQERDKLMVVKPALLEKRFGIDVHLEEAVLDIDTESKKVFTEKGEYAYDKLVFATGGRAIVPPIKNLAQYGEWAHAKTIEDFDKLMETGAIDKAHKITIIGAGLIGLETAENLQHIGKEVTVVELGNQILAPWDEKFARMGEEVLKDHGINLKLGVSVDGVDTESGNITLSNGETLESDFMIIGISVKPNTEMLVQKGAEHIKNGALIVNEKMETTIPDVYAAGDCASIPNYITGTDGWFPMGTHSNKGGRAAGANAAGGHETFPGGYGTAIMQMFDYTIARTGMGPKALTQEGIPFKSTFVIAGVTPGFMPNQKDMYLEIYYHAETNQLLGAEAFGEKGVDKRIDVLATAIYAKLKVQDLPNLDLAYAPPFSPAKDPVVVAGYVASNSVNGPHQEVTVLDLDQRMVEEPQGDYTILDVRNPGELKNKGFVKGSVNIPLEQLRDSLDQLDKNKEIYIYCAKGLRGYLAALILTHNGFQKVYNVGGGFTAWEKIVHKISHN